MFLYISVRNLLSIKGIIIKLNNMWLKKFGIFNKEVKTITSESEVAEEVSAVKKKRSNEITTSFMDNFEYPPAPKSIKTRDGKILIAKNAGADINEVDLSLTDYEKKCIEESLKEAKSLSGPKPMIMNEANKKLLKESIVIMLKEIQKERNDLLFVGNSRINGNPIYIYKGSNISNFELPFEEVIGAEDYYTPNVSQIKSYSDYISDNLYKTINYTEYLSNESKYL
jgi:hypothetical protein